MTKKLFVDKKLILIVGFRKCGTSTLYDYLVSQKVGQGCIIKEPQLLCSGNDFDQAFINKYLSLFDDNSDVLIDGSTFIVNDPLAIEKVKSIFREVKIIVCVRNPVERFFSAYWHCRGKEIKQEPRTIDEVVANIDAWKYDRYEQETEWVNKCEYYNNYYGLDYIRKQGIDDVDFKPINNRLAFMYYGEGCYSLRLTNFDISEILIVYFEDFIIGGFCIDELANYLNVELSRDGLKTVGVSNKGLNKSDVEHLNTLKRIKVHKLFPSSLRKKIKKLFYKPIPTTSDAIKSTVTEWYVDEINYWLEIEPRLAKYWPKNKGNNK